jgi:hypothetical protein
METTAAVLLIGLIRLVVPFSLLVLVGSWLEGRRRRNI